MILDGVYLNEKIILNYVEKIVPDSLQSYQLLSDKINKGEELSVIKINN